MNTSYWKRAEELDVAIEAIRGPASMREVLACRLQRNGVFSAEDWCLQGRVLSVGIIEWLRAKKNSVLL